MPGLVVAMDHPLLRRNSAFVCKLFNQARQAGLICSFADLNMCASNSLSTSQITALELFECPSCSLQIALRVRLQ